MFGIFNVYTDVDACNCPGDCMTTIRVCTGSYDTISSPWARYQTPPHPLPGGDFLRQWFLDSSVCVFSISACLQDELLCFKRLSEMVHSSLMAWIKMGVSLTNPKQLAAIQLFGHTEILHMLVSMGSTALAGAVVLPRYGGLNYVCGVNEDWKRKKCHTA